MICAFNEELKRKICLGSELLKKHPRKYTWICPNLDCKELLSYVIDHERNLSDDITTHVIAHFRHQSGKTCDSESDTYWHTTIKNYLYDILPKFNNIKLIKKEHRIGNQIADIYIELTNGTKIAIELQHSPLKYDELMKRTNGYINKGIFPFWILDAKGTCVSQPEKRKYTSYEHHIRTSQLERDIFVIFDRLYYIDILNQHLDLDNIKIYCTILLESIKYSEYLEREVNYNTMKNIILKKVKILEIETIYNIEPFEHVRFISKEMDDELKEQEKRRKQRKKSKERLKKKHKRTQEIIKKQQIHQSVLELIEMKKEENVLDDIEPFCDDSIESASFFVMKAEHKLYKLDEINSPDNFKKWKNIVEEWIKKHKKKVKEIEWKEQNILLYKGKNVKPPKLVESEYGFDEYMYEGYCSNCNREKRIIVITTPNKYIDKKLYLCKRCSSVYKKELHKIKKQMKRIKKK